MRGKSGQKRVKGDFRLEKDTGRKRKRRKREEEDIGEERKRG